MDILEKRSDSDLIKSLLAETAKAKNELSCAQRDVAKATGRLDFALVILNEMISRQRINRNDTNQTL